MSAPPRRCCHPPGQHRNGGRAPAGGDVAGTAAGTSPSPGNTGLAQSGGGLGGCAAEPPRPGGVLAVAADRYEARRRPATRSRDGHASLGGRLAGMDEQDGYLDERTRQWIQQEADAHHGGNWGRAAAAILEAAHAAQLAPDDPWAEVRARVQRRGSRPASS